VIARVSEGTASDIERALEIDGGRFNYEQSGNGCELRKHARDEFLEIEFLQL
jgi:hypothetical protein